jgi:hypothetical protein
MEDKKSNGIIPSIDGKSSLALDDEAFRRQNTEKLVNLLEKGAETLSKGAELMVEGKKTSLAFTRYVYFFLVLISLLFLVSISGWVVSSGSLDKAFHNTYVPDDANKRVVCFMGLENMSFKKAEINQLYYYKAAFGNQTNCVIMMIS